MKKVEAENSNLYKVVEEKEKNVQNLTLENKILRQEIKRIEERLKKYMREKVADHTPPDHTPKEGNFVTATGNIFTTEISV